MFNIVHGDIDAFEEGLEIFLWEGKESVAREWADSADFTTGRIRLRGEKIVLLEASRVDAENGQQPFKEIDDARAFSKALRRAVLGGFAVQQHLEEGFEVAKESALVPLTASTVKDFDRLVAMVKAGSPLAQDVGEVSTSLNWLKLQSIPNSERLQGTYPPGVFLG